MLELCFESILKGLAYRAESPHIQIPQNSVCIP